MLIKRKITVAVTGANGYIGRQVVKYLLERNCEVICIDVSFSDLPYGAKIVNANILDCNEKMYEELGEPEVVIHLAWRKGFIHTAPEHMLDVSKHFSFIRNMLISGLKNLTVMGTMHEVGYFEGCINENTPCNPLSQYGIAKHALQTSLSEMINREHNDVSFKWLRGFYIHGNDEFSSSIFSKILMAESNGQALFPFNSGKNKYDFISVEEIAKQIAESALQTKIDGIINCCSGNPISLADKVEKFIKDRNLNIRLDFGKFPDRAYDSPLIYGNNEKISKILSNCRRTEL